MAEFSIPKGMRDFSPEEMAKREYVLGVITGVYKKYGFRPLETPAIEFQETLSNKYGEEEKLVWQFKDLGGRDVALRYDLTVPLSRYVAMNRNIAKPFKRYQIGRVWRYDQPQKGRYREFWQCDIDILGPKSPMADAEIIAIIYETLMALGFEKFTVRVNNRKLMDCVYQAIGVPEESLKDIYVCVDKLGKQGINGVRKEMSGRGISTSLAEKVLEITGIAGKPEYVLGRAAEYAKGIDAQVALSETRELFEYVAALGIPEDYISFDLSLARGLDYYTSFVFETVVTEPDIGSLTGGGRYDGLIGRFSGEDVPATGTSIGFERIVDAMNELKMFSIPKTSLKAFVASAKDETRPNVLEIAGMLRKNGFGVDYDIMQRNLRKQLEYAANLGVPFAIIVGPNELKEDRVTLRNMDSGKETQVEIKNLADVLKVSQ